MNKEIMQKWVAALRSGEYKQIDGRLRSYEPDECGKYSYCCLGVLCELHRLEQGAGEWGTSPHGHNGHLTAITTAYDGKPNTLPLSVQKWAGLIMSSPVVYYKLDEDSLDDLPAERREHELTDLNDDAMLYFTQIADVIEEQWKDL